MALSTALLTASLILLTIPLSESDLLVFVVVVEESVVDFVDSVSDVLFVEEVIV